MPTLTIGDAYTERVEALDTLRITRAKLAAAKQLVKDLTQEVRRAENYAQDTLTNLSRMARTGR